MSQNFSIAQMKTLADALEFNGWSANDVEKLCEGHVLSLIRQIVLSGELRHTIESDTEPGLLPSYRILSHQGLGSFIWAPDKINMFPLDRNKKYFSEKGLNDDTLKEARQLRVLNGTVGQYLAMNPSIIPQDWQRYKLLFPGTIFQFECNRYLFALFWKNKRWKYECRPIHVGGKPSEVIPLMSL